MEIMTLIEKTKKYMKKGVRGLTANEKLVLVLAHEKLLTLEEAEEKYPEELEFLESIRLVKIDWELNEVRTTEKGEEAFFQL